MPQLVLLWVEDVVLSLMIHLLEAALKNAELLVRSSAVHFLVLALRLVKHMGLPLMAQLGSELLEYELAVQSSVVHWPESRLHGLEYLGLSAEVHQVVCVLRCVAYGCSHRAAHLESVLHCLGHVLPPWAVPSGESVVR